MSGDRDRAAEYTAAEYIGDGDGHRDPAESATHKCPGPPICATCDHPPEPAVTGDRDRLAAALRTWRLSTMGQYGPGDEAETIADHLLPVLAQVRAETLEDAAEALNDLGVRQLRADAFDSADLLRDRAAAYRAQVQP